MSSIQQARGIAQVPVSTDQTIQALSNQQAAEVFQTALSKGVDVVQDERAGGYYMRVAIQPSAAEGERFVQVDRQLAEQIIAALKTGGRISQAEVMSKIMPEITDGGRYGQGEAILARLLLAATDDRKKVLINGRRIHITDAAETVLNHELFSFWGTLGARARWGVHDPGVEPSQPSQRQNVELPDQKAQNLVGANPQKGQLPKI